MSSLADIVYSNVLFAMSLAAFVVSLHVFEWLYYRLIVVRKLVAWARRRRHALPLLEPSHRHANPKNASTAKLTDIVVSMFSKTQATNFAVGNLSVDYDKSTHTVHVTGTHDQYNAAVSVSDCGNCVITQAEKVHVKESYREVRVRCTQTSNVHVDSPHAYFSLSAMQMTATDCGSVEYSPYENGQHSEFTSYRWMEHWTCSHVRFAQDQASLVEHGPVKVAWNSSTQQLEVCGAEAVTVHNANDVCVNEVDSVEIHKAHTVDSERVHEFVSEANRVERVKYADHITLSSRYADERRHTQRVDGKFVLHSVEFPVFPQMFQ